MKSNFTILLKSFLMVLFLSLGFLGWGQNIWQNEITGTNPNTGNPYTTGDVKNVNITVSGIGRGAGINGTNANNRYNTNGWSNASNEVAAVNSEKYFYFTLSPNEDYRINFSSFSCTYQKSNANNSPTNYVLRSSVDNYVSNISTGTLVGATATAIGSISLSNNAFQEVDSEVTFRLYAWSTGNGSGTFSINDFQFSGTVEEELIEEPTLLISETEITDLGYMEGNPSISKVFSVNGINLDGTNVVITAPTNFQVSLDGIFYSNTLNLTYNDATLVATDVYVRLNSGLSIGDYTGDVIISGGDAPNKIVSLTAEIIEFSLICGQEGFDEICILSCVPASSSYGNRAWEGTGGEWVATLARTDQTITGNALTIRSGTITSPSFNNGIGSITMTTKLPYSDSSNNLTIRVNNNIIGTIAYSSVVQTFTIDDINIEGTIIITIEETNNHRVTIDDISWTCYTSNSVVWTIDNEWSNVTGPTIDDNVVVEGDLFVGTDFLSFEAKSLTVNVGGSLYVESGNYVTVAGQIVNAAGASNFIVESGASLRQTTDYTGANEGEITVDRDSQLMKRLDYTLWSSPVEGMLLRDFSDVSLSGGEGTLWNRVYTLGATAWEQVWNTQTIFQADNTTTFTEAKGYLYRSRNDFPAENSIVFEGEFIGVPNNGTKTITTTNEYDAVGNPYPSTINADLFFGENDDATAVYFWTNTNPAVGETYEGQGTNWASYTLAGGVGTDSADNSSVVPNGLIAAGQGFVVENLGSSVVFNNGMRVGNTGMFFKTMGTEKHRLWLNLSVENITLNQMMIAYMDGATEGVDVQIDGKMYGYEGSALYSIITSQQDAYTIQGRSLPFSDTDAVNLGFRANQAGTYMISLADFDGLFVEGQNIYLKDNTTQTEHDLKNGNYSFISEEGIFENRFEVIYKTNTDLSTNNPTLDNKWVVYSQGNELQIETLGFDMKNVTIYDLLGRTVYNSQVEGTNHIVSNVANGVFVVKVVTDNNQTLIKKIAK